MTRIFRKGRAERTGYTVLKTAENVYIGASYRRQQGSTSSTGSGQTGTGSPVGVVTPSAIGGLYTDQTPPYAIWMATGLGNTNWQELVGN